VFRFAFFLGFCGALAQGFQNNNVSADSEREKDVYTIYSLILNNPFTNHGPDHNERILIAATTATHGPQEPCVVPPKERERPFREVRADYERRKEQSRELKSAFSIRKPYLLLKADDVTAFMKERWPTPTPEAKVPDERFRGATDVFTLSEVYFNPRRTLALAEVSSWCGGLCGMHQWRVFEKSNTGKWEERPWVTCFSVAGVRLLE
jgi:hypothetical protein